MAYEYESKETRVLKTIDSQRYPETNKDFVKNIRRLNSSVDYISSYMRVMQKGIDDANKSFIEQIQSFINDLVVIFAGGEPTGIELGDLKYILQAIGALFGFNGPFPVNLLNAAAHFFQGFIAPITQLSDLIFDAIEAWMLDLIDKAGNIPLIGGAVTSIAQWIIDATNGIQQGIEDAADAFAHAGEIIDSFLRALGVPTFADVEKWFENLFGGLLYGIDFGDGFDLFEAAQWFINIVLFPVNLIAKLVGGFLEVFRIPGLDASKITSGTFAQSMISGLVDALGNLGKFINDVIDAIEGAFRGIPIIGSGIANMINGIQQFFNGLFGAPTPQPTIQAPAVPGVDASKITTGTFGSGQIADAAVTQAKIADSAVSTAKIANLAVTGGKTSGLDGSKITGGTVAPAYIGDLPTSKITTGTFGTAFIADSAVSTAKIANLAVTGGKTASLDGAKITTGSVAADRIASLNASKITAGTFGTAFIADDAITNAKIGALAVGTAEIANEAVTGSKTTGLDGSKITDGTIAAARLPGNVISTVGSGITMSRNNGTGGGTYQAAWSGNGEILPSTFYNVVGANTPDLTKVTVNTNKLGVRATYAGWYLVEVGYQLDINTNFGFSWALTPAIAINSASITKWGASALSARDTAAFTDRSDTCPWAQSSFIAYLGANEYVSPAYVAIRDGTNSGTAGIITPVGGGLGTYFSVALLNRSLS